MKSHRKEQTFRTKTRRAYVSITPQMRVAFDIGDEVFRKRVEGKFEKLEKYLEDDTV